MRRISAHPIAPLLAPHEGALRGYVHRLVAHPQDAEELLQDTLVKACERFASLRDRRAFRSWLFQIATRTCLDHLRKQQRWRPYSQRYVEDECAESAPMRDEVVATTRDPEFAFDVYEHVAFCFTCVGRSLPPLEQAAVMLREILGFTNAEAAEIAGVSEPRLRHALARGREQMRETYEGLCALVNKEGVCRQCAGFRQATAETRRGPSLPVLQPWSARVDAVKQKEFTGGVSETLHRLLFARIERLEAAAHATPRKPG